MENIWNFADLAKKMEVIYKEIKMKRRLEYIGLINPWSKDNSKRMNWPEIVAWSYENINPKEQKNWK